MPNDYPYESGYKRFQLLTVAIDAYRSAALSTAKHGANEFVRLFRMRQSSVQNSDVIKLEDANATGQAIREALQTLQTAQDAYEDPTAREGGIVIYVAGHAVVRRTRDGVPVAYFAPHDYKANPSRTDWDWNTFVPLEAFTEARHFMAAKHVLFIFDCCFAGAAFSRSMLAMQTDFETERSTEKSRFALEARHKKPKTTINERDVAIDLNKRFTGRCAYQVLAAGNHDQPVLDVSIDPDKVKPSPEVSTKSHSPSGGLKGRSGGRFRHDHGGFVGDLPAGALRQLCRITSAPAWLFTRPRWGRFCVGRMPIPE